MKLKAKEFSSLVIDYLRTAQHTIRGYGRIGSAELSSSLRSFLSFRSLHAKGSKHLLILAWQFPPMIAGGVYRPAALARYASTSGWNVTVFAGPAPSQITEAGLHMSRYIPSNVVVRRIKNTAVLRTSHSYFPRVDGGFLNALETVRIGRLELKESPPHIILASGPPFHSFIAGYYLARYFSSRLVLEYRDEWTECSFPFIERGNTDRYWERRCLGAADAVIFTTKSQLRHQIGKFQNLDPGKCLVIPNGWEPADVILHEDPVLPDTNSKQWLTLAFVGVLEDHTLPGPFLTALEALIRTKPIWSSRLRIIFAGRQSTQARSQLLKFEYQDMLELKGEVPRPVAMSIMRRATALVIFNTSHFHRYLPGKLYDYLASRRPILVYGAGGEIEELVNALQAGVVVEEGNLDELEHALYKLSDPAGLKFSSSIEDWLQAHTRKALSMQTLYVLDQL